MREIYLSKGYFTLVDDEDYDRVTSHGWHAHIQGRNRDRITAARTTKIEGRKRTIYLHRILLNAPSDLDVDHINHNTLDNRKANLRLATTSQNSANHNQVLSASGFRGVYASGKRWMCRFKKQHYELFDTPEEAARRFDELALIEFGEFATLNFPNSAPRASAA